jgi:hypothetical protein
MPLERGLALIISRSRFILIYIAQYSQPSDSLWPDSCSRHRIRRILYSPHPTAKAKFNGSNPTFGKSLPPRTKPFWKLSSCYLRKAGSPKQIDCRHRSSRCIRKLILTEQMITAAHSSSSRWARLSTVLHDESLNHVWTRHLPDHRSRAITYLVSTFPKSHSQVFKSFDFQNPLHSLSFPYTSMPVGIEAWITQIPPITRSWLALAVLTSLAVVR